MKKLVTVTETRIRNLGALLLLVFSASLWAQDPDFHIYLALGQSNMEGQGAIETQDRTVDSRFQVIASLNCSNLGRTQGQWYTATPPLFRCNTGLSPVDYFGRTLVESLPNNIRVGVVNVAIAGSKIELFDKANYQSYVATAESWMKSMINEYGGNPYARLVAMAKLAQQEGVIKGILLHQGESNTGDSQWPSKVKGVYDNLIADLGLDASKVPLIAGEVVGTAEGGSCGSMNSIIATLPRTIANAHVVSSSGLGHQGDQLHFTSASYRTLGRRYAEKMLDLLGSIEAGPQVSIGAPSASAHFEAPAQISFEVTITPAQASISKVEFKNGTTLLGESSTAPYSFVWQNAPAGLHSITVIATDSEGKTGTASISIRVVAPQAPYGGSPAAIPGTIQLENYDLGGNGFAYLDNTPGSETDVSFRADEDVDIEVSTDAGGGYNIGWATAGEWLEYTVDVAGAGMYRLELRVACEGTGRTVSLESNGEVLASDIEIPNTGGWQSWETVVVENVQLVAGRQVLRLTVGAVDFVNLNSMILAWDELVPLLPTGGARYRTLPDDGASGLYKLNGARIPPFAH